MDIEPGGEIGHKGEWQNPKEKIRELQKKEAEEANVICRGIREDCIDLYNSPNAKLTKGSLGWLYRWTTPYLSTKVNIEGREIKISVKVTGKKVKGRVMTESAKVEVTTLDKDGWYTLRMEPNDSNSQWERELSMTTRGGGRLLYLPSPLRLPYVQKVEQVVDQLKTAQNAS